MCLGGQLGWPQGFLATWLCLNVRYCHIHCHYCLSQINIFFLISGSKLLNRRSKCLEWKHLDADRSTSLNIQPTSSLKSLTNTSLSSPSSTSSYSFRQSSSLVHSSSSAVVVVVPSRFPAMALSSTCCWLTSRVLPSPIMLLRKDSDAVMVVHCESSSAEKFRIIQRLWTIHRESKKEQNTKFFLSVTLPNIDRFSKFFHSYTR